MDTTSTAPPAKSKRVLKRAVTVVVLLTVFGALAWPKLNTGSGAGGQGAGQGRAPDTLQVSAYVISPSMLASRINTNGSIIANESVDLVSEASGKLIQILFQEGSYVERGQLLVKINDAELQAQLQRAEYRLTLAEEREGRQRQILEKGGISQEEYDAVLNEVNVLRSEIQVVRAQLAQTEIRAPFSGVVGLRYVSEGSYISPQTRIATLQSLNPIKIDFSVPEKYAGLIQTGSVVNYRVQGTEQVFRGQVYAVEPRIDQNTRTLQIRALTPNPNGALLPGAFATVELIMNEMNSALVIPSISVIPDMAGKRVFVYEDGKAMSRNVETGIRTDSMLQVLAGLASGDTVITSGLQQLRPGSPVRLSGL